MKPNLIIKRNTTSSSTTTSTSPCLSKTGQPRKKLHSFQALQSVGLVTGMTSMSSSCNRELLRNVKNTISQWFTSLRQSRIQPLGTSQCWSTEHPLQRIATWTIPKSLPLINKFWLFVNARLSSKRMKKESFLIHILWRSSTQLRTLSHWHNNHQDKQAQVLTFSETQATRLQQCKSRIVMKYLATCQNVVISNKNTTWMLSCCWQTWSFLKMIPPRTLNLKTM